MSAFTRLCASCKKKGFDSTIQRIPGETILDRPAGAECDRLLMLLGQDLAFLQNVSRLANSLNAQQFLVEMCQMFGLLVGDPNRVFKP